MLNYAGLPYPLWMYAVHTATTLINLLPTITNEDHKSPRECLAEFLHTNDPNPMSSIFGP